MIATVLAINPGWIAFALLWLWVAICMTAPAKTAKASESQKIMAFVTILLAWPFLLWYFMVRQQPKV